ncbi:MAG: hypothetical protein RLZZ309_1036 [Bacteroidota bacterium]|jgi:uncharacterized protein involved in cysteine biosynthesis
MNQEQQNYYNIPVQYRKMENLHIVFWIFKDIGWCMGFAWLGILMIIPTIIISIVIAWRTRNIVSELCHNLAITVWISANSFWMCTEFFGVDEHEIGYGFTLKHVAMIPFLIGMFILGYYYIWYKPRHQEDLKTL